MISDKSTMVLTIVMMSMIIPTYAIIAYDCTGTNLTISTISINSIQDCKESTSLVMTTTDQFQLLEIAETVSVDVFSCDVEVSRLVTHCGMSSHATQVENGFGSFIHTLGRERCYEAHNTGTTTLEINAGGYIKVSDLKSGQRKVIHKVLGGSIYSSKSPTCDGGYYSDVLGQWWNVVVNAQITITLSRYPASANLVKDVVHLKNGLSCPYKLGKCVDTEAGEVYWDLKTDDTCHTQTYKTLYSGTANVTLPVNHTNVGKDYLGAIVSVETQDTVFSFRLTGRHTLCYLKTYSTDHPRLLLVQDAGAGFVHKQTTLAADDMDLFTYVNSKFVYIDRIHSINFQNLYNYIVQQDCVTRHQVLQQHLALALISPQEFAYIVGKGPGFAGTLSGEVIYITKCHPVKVSIRRTSRCYQELPVLYQNQSLYLTPKYHTLVQHGTETSCSTVLSPMYLLDNSWWNIADHPVRTTSPDILNPNTEVSWKYIEPAHLADAGIYTSEDLDTLRSHLMYGVEREAISNIISRGYAGLNPDEQDGSFGNFLTPDGIKKMGNEFLDKIWSGFYTFGNISAGIIGIVSVIQIIKWFLDTIIHVKALHDVYGWSLTLFAAIWDSLTLFLIHRATRTRMPRDHTDKDVESEDKPIMLVTVKPEASEKFIPTAPATGQVHHSIYPNLHNDIHR